MSFANFVQAQLAEPLAIDGVSITLAPAVAPNQPPPVDGGVLVLTDSLGKPSFVEIIRYTSREGQILIGLERGVEGTIAREWPTGSYCYQSLTAGGFKAALAPIADGLVTSVASKSGVVTVEDLSAGGVATQAGAETLSNKTLEGAVHTGVIDQTGSVRSNIVSLVANTLNCSLGNYFTRTISANSTFAFSNVPVSRAYSCTLELTHTSGTVTWPTSVQWPGGTAPTLTTGKTHIFVFVTDDGGARWRGAALTNYTN